MTTPSKVSELAKKYGKTIQPAEAAVMHGPMPKPGPAIPGLAKAGRPKASPVTEAAEVGRGARAAMTDSERRDRNDLLSAHLVDSGRANAPAQTSAFAKPKKVGLDDLGGARTPATEKRAEASAGRVLAGIEAGTQDAQVREDPDAPLAHAVSAHGPGSDQLGRLLHGRRAEEIEADRAKGAVPSGKVKLSGGVRDVEVDAYTSVGTTPSNTAGSFTSNQGMLSMVGEAFARADAFSRAVEPAPTPRPPGWQPPKKGAEPAKDPFAPSALDDTSFVTNVGGRGVVGDKGAQEAVGENLTVKGGLSDQSESTATHTQGLARDEMQERYKAVERSDAHAGRFVLRPATGSGGKRAGWQMQTAYPVDTRDQQWDAPQTSEQLKNSKQSLESASAVRQRDLVEHDKKIKELTEKVKAAKALVGSKKSALSGLQGGIKASTNKIAAADAILKAKPGDAAAQKVMDTEPTVLAERRAQEVEAADAIVKANAAVPVSEAELQKAKDARKPIDAAAKAAKAELLAKHPPGAPAPAAAAPSGPKVAGVYNAATGHIQGDRPAKPDDSIKGKDENNVDLTAHHVYPWNKLRDQINAALDGNDRPKLEALFTFGDVDLPKLLPAGKDATWFWGEMAKPFADREYLFGEVLNRAAPWICWTPRNIFMGPKGELRSDDPGEELDAIFTAGGLPTPASAFGELVSGHGFGPAGPAAPDAAAKPDKAAQSGRKAELDEAVATGNRVKLKALLESADVNLPDLLGDKSESWFYDELDKKPAERAPEFAAVIKRISPSVSWATSRAAPSAAKPGNDSKRRLAEILMQNRRQGENAGPRTYKQDEWVKGAGGKKSRRGLGKSEWKTDKLEADAVAAPTAAKPQPAQATVGLKHTGGPRRDGSDAWRTLLKTGDLDAAAREHITALFEQLVVDTPEAKRAELNAKIAEAVGANAGSRIKLQAKWGDLKKIYVP